MTLPLLSTISNVYIDGVLNKQWNSNGGTFGLLIPEALSISTYGANGYGANGYGGEVPLDALPFVVSTSTPSFFGASSYDARDSFFSAKVQVPVGGNGSIQTSLVIKANEKNFIEMYVGPYASFGAYVANNGVPTPISTPFPTYDPINHAYWRIRNYYNLFFFDVSKDGFSWVTLGSSTYTWDASAVTVMFFSGFTGNEPPGLQAYLSNVNKNNNLSTLSASVTHINSVTGNVILAEPNPLSASVNQFFNRLATFNIVLNIPQGGMTDLALSDSFDDDAATARLITQSLATGPGNTISWQRPYNTSVPSVPYRDGSYWQPAKTAVLNVGALNNDTGPNLMTNVQYENVPGSYNRLSTNASFYTQTCEYAAQKSLTAINSGSTNVTRSKDIAYAGNYSGKVQFGGTPAVDGAGHNAYWVMPTKKAIVPIINNTLGQETLRGSVTISTTRAGTQWYPAAVLYDANFNILSQTSFLSATTPTIVTHPGGGVWQTASVVMPSGASTAVGMAVVPVIIVPGTTPETIYIGAHRIVGITPAISSYPTTFTNPRQINITLKADRINYALNAGFNTDISGWNKSSAGTSGTPDSLSISWDNTTGFNSLGSLKASLAAPSGSYTGTANAITGPASYIALGGSTVYPIIQGLKIGHTYTFSAWVKQGVNCPDVTMNVIDANYNGTYGISTNAIRSANPGAIVNGWTQVQTTMTIPPNGGSDYRLWFTVNYVDIVARAPFNFWLDGILVEETNTAGSFFDGSFPSPDYQFELGGSADTSRSHYYNGFTNKISRVNTIIPQYSPLGSTFSILTAQPPT